MLDQKSYLKKVDEVKAEFDNLAGQQKKMEEFFREGWFPLKPNVAPTPPEELQIEGKAESTFLRRSADDFQSSSEVVQPLAEMNDKFLAMHSQQVSLLKQAHFFSQHKLEKTSVLLTKLGIRPSGSTTLATADMGAMGGPFISLPEAARRDAEIADGMKEVHNTLYQESKVREAVADLPLAKPMANITGISSFFGYRKDPLRLSMAFHGGIDFKGVYGEPVLTTSNGTVTWAGAHGPYGNLVEIIHDNGVSTRYGHMKSVNVSLGQKISRGDVIGWMGSTGRSTGPHLHYETRVDGRVIDPHNFWRTQNDLQALEKLN